LTKIVAMKSPLEIPCAARRSDMVYMLRANIFFWPVAMWWHVVMKGPIFYILWQICLEVVEVVETMVFSYPGMYVPVFANMLSEDEKNNGPSIAVGTKGDIAGPGLHDGVDQQTRMHKAMVNLKQSLSVITPAYNEEVAIADTVHSVVAMVSQWTKDFEVIVVNDGSRDNTGAILAEISAADPRVRVINHEVNRGYGAALVSGFEAAAKDLIFFMDSDGQFDIQDLARFFPLIEKYDAVLGYRINRQDTWMRKLNAWGWKMLVSSVFKLSVRDVDCAFKLYRAEIFHNLRLETRGAMINTEILYKLKRSGYTYTQVGVQHLPRRGGRATGAKPAVIARAFRELFVYARKWHREEQAEQAARQKRTTKS
jgi:hypothetical protein